MSSVENFQMAQAGVAPGITLVGEWDGIGNTLQGHPVGYLSGLGNQVNFAANGTDCALNCFGNGAGNFFSYSIDGGAPQIATPGAAYTAFSLYTGLADGLHTVQLNFGASSPEAIWVDQVNALTVAGAAPTLSYAPGFGAVYPAGGANIENTGTWKSRVWAYTNAVAELYAPGDDQQRFEFSGEQVKAFVNCGSGFLANARLDGKTIGAIDIPATTGSYHWVTLVSGLSPAQPHTLSFGPDDGGVFGVVCYTVAGGTMSSELPDPRDTYAFYGDSITVSEQASAADSGVYGVYSAPAHVLYSGYPHVFSDLNNVAIVSRGVGGTSVQPTGTAEDGGGGSPYCGQNRTADITSLSPAPRAIVVEYGTNDMAPGAYAPAPAGFSTSYSAMLASLVAGCPNSKILCMGILPRDGYDRGTISSYSDAISACAAALGSDNVRYVDPYDWIIPGTDQQPGGIHPNTVGAAKIATQLSTMLAAFFSLPLEAAASISQGSAAPSKAQQIATLAAEGTTSVTIAPGTKSLASGQVLPIENGDVFYSIVVGTATVLPNDVAAILHNGGYY